MSTRTLYQHFIDILPKYEEFIDEKNYAEDSIKQRTIYLRKFYQYIDALYSNPPSRIEFITEDHVLHFLEHLKNKKSLSLATRDNYFKNIKYFYKFLYDIGIMKNNILQDKEGLIKNRYLWERQYKYFKKEEIHKILATARNIYYRDKNIFNYRNYIIICIVCYLGVKLNELINIKVNDIDEKLSTITFHGKHCREVYLSFNLMNLIGSYNNEKDKYNSGEYLFFSRENDKLSKKAVQNIMNDIIKEADVILDERPPAVNTIRHSVIKMMIEEKWELAIISDIAGISHRSLIKYIDLFSSDFESLKIECLEKHPFFESFKY